MELKRTAEAATVVNFILIVVFGGGVFFEKECIKQIKLKDSGVLV